MKKIWPFLNPVRWFRAWRYARQSSRFDKSQFDLELWLYSRILRNDMLHYGYFEDPSIPPEQISLQAVEDAQVRYAENILDQIRDREHPVLDVGCGMGGLSGMMLEQGLKVESLTPNKNQIEYIRQKYPELPAHALKFEKFQTDTVFGTVINSESLQYIPLEDAFSRVKKMLRPGGRWIIVDYFRIRDDGRNTSGHRLEDFRSLIEREGWTLIKEQDITQNVVPTIALVNMYVERFLLPIKHFGYEKLRFKKPALYFMTDGIREGIERKLTKERASVDPEQFLAEKQYLFFVLERT